MALKYLLGLVASFLFLVVFYSTKRVETTFGCYMSSVGVQTNGIDEIWWHKYVEESSRVYAPWRVSNIYDVDATNYSDPNLYSWCRPAKLRPEQMTGLIYIKSHKASSSSCGGIAHIIARNVARRAFPDWFHKTGKSCDHSAFHETGDMNLHADRHPTNSLLWSFVRYPSKRDMSSVFFFRVSNGANLSDADIISALKLEKNKQVRYLSPHIQRFDRSWPGFDAEIHQRMLVDILRKDIFENYEFIGLTERMDESLAVMTYLWNLHPKDVITFSSKQSGGYTNELTQNECVKILKPNGTTAVNEYLKRDHVKDNYDFFLYSVVNRSLDKTINEIGHDRILKRVEVIRNMRRTINNLCIKDYHPPCSDSGQLQLDKAKESCIVMDTACGYKCVERELEKFKTD